MYKLFICLLFIAYVVCDDEYQTFIEDEIDITTRISNKAKIEPATNSKQNPNEYSDERAKGYEKDKQGTNAEDPEAQPTPVVETQPKEIDRKDENSEEKHQKTNGERNAKEKDVKGSDAANEEKTGSESNVDLGKDYKKISIKEKNRENNKNNDYNRGFNTEDKETVGTGADDTSNRKGEDPVDVPEAQPTPVVETHPKEIDRKDENSEEKHQKTNGNRNAKEKDVKETYPPNDEKTGSESDVDLGKDYIKVSVNKKNRENNKNNDYNRDKDKDVSETVGKGAEDTGSRKDVIEDKAKIPDDKYEQTFGTGAEDTGSRTDVFEDKAKKPDNKYEQTVGTGADDTGSRKDVFEDRAKIPDDKYGADRDYEDDKGVAGNGGQDSKAVKNGNEIMDELLVLMKQGFRSEMDKVKLEDVAPIKHGRWGTVTLHSGILSGLANAERVGDVLVKISEENKKLIIGDIAINDVYADYKVNAKLYRISINNRELKLSLKKAVLNVVLEVDPKEKKLYIRELELKSTEGFGVKSGRLFWPFNKLTDAILKSQEQVIKDIIKAEISKYMGKVVHNIKFEDVFAKLF